jgi:hypothetical protein
MRLRTIVTGLAATGSLLTPVVALATTGTAGAATVEACKNELTGQFLAATKIGTEGADYFSASLPDWNPNKLRNGDVVVAQGGNDTIDVSGLYGLTICAGNGNDSVTNGASAYGPVSARGGPGDDTLWTTYYSDGVNGLEGFDRVFDPTQHDWDICRQVEVAQNCELIGF